jgi:hypothetical protein
MIFDAVMFLEELFRQPDSAAPLAPPAAPGIGPENLPADWRVEWEERAAIMEYDGGLPRERAEAVALTDILRQLQRAGVPIRR